MKIVGICILIGEKISCSTELAWKKLNNLAAWLQLWDPIEHPFYSMYTHSQKINDFMFMVPALRNETKIYKKKNNNTLFLFP